VASSNSDSIENQNTYAQTLKYKRAYHDVIRTDGHLIPLIDHTEVIGHCGVDHNSQSLTGKTSNMNSIGISVFGNYEIAKMPDAQLKGLIDSIWSISQELNIPLGNIIRHKDVIGNQTQCPGRYYPYEELLTALANSMIPKEFKFTAGQSAYELDGLQKFMDKDVVNIWGNTSIPIRSFFESMGYEVIWNQQTKQIECRRLE